MDLTALCASVLCGSLPSAAPQSPDPAADAITAYVRTCEALGWSGVVLVRRGGTTLHHAGHGLADRAAGRPNDKETRFEIASMSKPITAAAVLSLVDDGKVDLDASIAEYLPGVPEHARRIEVRHLLTHTSGMPRSAGGGHGSDLEKAVTGYLTTKPTHAAGQREEYWNGGYALLAGIVERVAQRPFEEFVRERIFARAGMHASGFTGDDVADEHEAIGYETGLAPRYATTHPYRDAGWHYRGMGGVVSTAGDLLRFLDALDDGTLLEADTAASMWTAEIDTYGLGFGVAPLGGGSVRRGHGGDVRGFHGYMTSIAAEELTVIVLSNFGPQRTFQLVWNLEALALGEEPPYPTPPAREAWKDADLEALCGTWEARDERVTIARSRAGSLRVTTRPRGEAVDRAATVAREFVEAIAEHRLDDVRSRTAERYAETWPRTLVETVWPKRVAARGALEAVQFVNADIAGATVTLHLRLVHARGAENARLIVQGDDEPRVHFFDPAASVDSFGVPEQAHWMPVGPRELVRWDWLECEVGGRWKLRSKPSRVRKRLQSASAQRLTRVETERENDR